MTPSLHSQLSKISSGNLSDQVLQAKEKGGKRKKKEVELALQ
jgi:hypothetical protein